MAKRGRKSKYFSHVEPYLDDIAEWSASMTEAQIARKLGVGLTAWYEYKAKYPKLSESIKKGRQDLVIELKSVLIKKAKGYTYEEKKVITDSEGYTRKEVTQKYAQPDVASINLLLKNYDRENWSNDPQALELKKKELELREKQVEANTW